MSVVFLFGGFGNNLFQISKAESLKLQGNEVAYNTFFLERNFIINILGWTVHDSSMTLKALKDERIINSLNFFDFISLFFSLVLSKFKVIDLMDFNSDFSIFGRYFGYYQIGGCMEASVATELFEKISSTINASFLGANVIHARRGDFISENQIEMRFYKKAIEKSNVKEFVVCSDDPTFIQELQFLFDSTYSFIESDAKSAADDFTIMASSSILIMSNSTFCYWSAVLGSVNSIYVPTKINPGLEWPFAINNANVYFIEAFDGLGTL